MLYASCSMGPQITSSSAFNSCICLMFCSMGMEREFFVEGGSNLSNQLISFLYQACTGWLVILLHMQKHVL